MERATCTVKLISSQNKQGNESASKALLSNLYTVPLEHKVDYEVRQTKTDQGDHHDDSDAMKQRLLKIGKKS
mgnify:CR=1 FL=1